MRLLIVKAKRVGLTRRAKLLADAMRQKGGQVEIRDFEDKIQGHKIKRVIADEIKRKRRE